MPNETMAPGDGGRRVGVIDIGTNTVLFLAGSLRDDGTLDVLVDEQRVGRLGAGVDATRTLSDDAIERVTAIVGDYQAIARAHRVESVMAFGTSALRDASNRGTLVGRLLREFDIPLTVISGDREAEMTYLGALEGLPKGGHTMVIDIGGGSTEFAEGRDETYVGGTSVDVGSVRLAERCLGSRNPCRHRDVERARLLLSESAPLTVRRADHMRLVGVAGTATTIAAAAAGLPADRLADVHGQQVSLSFLEEFAEWALNAELQELVEHASIVDERADILPAGALMLCEYVRMAGADHYVASSAGLRYGLLKDYLASNP